jgi:hypothetical protein
MDSVTIVSDTENGLLLLKAPEGAAGEANVTVTVRDPQNNTHQRTFRVTVAADTIDGAPYVEDIPTIRTTVGTAVTAAISARDVENSPTRMAVSTPTGITVAQPIRDFTPVGQIGTESFTFTPAAGLLGTFEIHVAAYRPQQDPNNAFMEDHLEEGAPDLRAGGLDNLLDRQVVLLSITRNVTCAIADITDDGRVNRADLALLSQSLGGLVTAGTGADIDGDGRVGTRDLLWIRQFLDQNCPASSPAAPAAVVAAHGDRPVLAPLHARRVDAAFAQPLNSRSSAVETRSQRHSAVAQTTLPPATQSSTASQPLLSSSLTARRLTATGQRTVDATHRRIHPSFDK